MKKLLLTLFLMFIYGGMKSQDIESRMKLYDAWITLNQSPNKIKGNLYQLKDSSVVLIRSNSFNSHWNANANLNEFPVYAIEMLKVRRKNSIKRGKLYGALVGIVIGGAVGYLQGDDRCETILGDCYEIFGYKAEEKAFFYSIPSGLLGAGIGALIGSARIEIPIEGDYKKYQSQQKKLNQFAIKRKEDYRFK